MKDVELMHMRYAMESAVLALGAMGNSKTNEVKSYQIAVCYLKDLRIHLEAINNIPRKVVYCPIHIIKLKSSVLLLVFTLFSHWKWQFDPLWFIPNGSNESSKKNS